MAARHNRECRGPPRAAHVRSTLSTVMPMKISVFAGDLCDVEAEALCTSTNPRLSLAMGSGGSVRDRGGYQILRECEEIVEAEFRRSGLRSLPAGSAHVTTSGDLPAKII